MFIHFSCFNTIIIKELVQTYICKLCNKETKNKEIYLDGHCASCKLLKLKMSYTATKLEPLYQFECHQQIKAMQKKEYVETESDLLDNISEHGNSDKDPHFVLFSVSSKQTEKSLIQKRDLRNVIFCLLLLL